MRRDGMGPERLRVRPGLDDGIGVGPHFRLEAAEVGVIDDRLVFYAAALGAHRRNDIADRGQDLVASSGLGGEKGDDTDHEGLPLRSAGRGRNAEVGLNTESCSTETLVLLAYRAH